MKKVSNFAERLQIAMDINGCRAVNIASSLNIDKSLLSRYLSGQAVPKQDKFDEIAKFLNVSHAWLLGYDVEMNVNNTITQKIINLLKECDDIQLSTILIYVDNILKEGRKKWFKKKIL